MEGTLGEVDMQRLRQLDQSDAEVEESIDIRTLDERQKEALDAAIRGESVFITGGAGTGKSLAMRAVVQELHRKYGTDFKDKVAVTGATGTAAVIVGGCTLHSATGIRVPVLTNDFKRIGQGIYREIWSSSVEVLLLDEASMISGEFFDLFEQQVRRVRSEARPGMGLESQPFGGLQVILVGDLFQLPPIFNQLDPEVVSRLKQDQLPLGRAVTPTPSNRSEHEHFLNRGMIFQSNAFWDLQLKVVELLVPHRQSADPTLADVLAKLRLGPDQQALVELNKRYFPLAPPGCKAADEEDDVFLLPRVQQVNAINRERLNELPGKSSLFRSQDDVEVAEAPENLTHEERLEFVRGREEILWSNAFFLDSHSSCPVAKTLELKPDALVMLVQTIDVSRNLVNGRTGRVLYVPSKPGSPVKVQFQGIDGVTFVGLHMFSSVIPGVGTCRRRQYPLRLAWAITHHRSQGKTLPGVVVEPQSFTYGQAYVALSRSPSLESLKLTAAARTSDFKVNPDSMRFTELLEKQAPNAEIREAVGHWRNVSLKSFSMAAAKRGPPPVGPPGPDETVTFGRYEGKTFKQVAGFRGYAQWVVTHGSASSSVGFRRFREFVLEQRASGHS